jgi:hypothetical protein
MIYVDKCGRLCKHIFLLGHYAAETTNANKQLLPVFHYSRIVRDRWREKIIKDLNS